MLELKSNPALTGQSAFEREVASGERFEFGANWRRFLSMLNAERISAATSSLKAALDVDTLAGKTFIDVGSGSGLTSLVARQLGATVFSFDHDPVSVWCTQELRHRYFTEDPNWIVQRGSVLDENYIRSLGQFDIVYSYGVLHHTGQLWRALDLAACLVKPETGRLFVAIYNDQGGASRRWKAIKKAYCRTPFLLKPLIVIPTGIALWWRPVLTGMIRRKPLRTWLNNGSPRGMSPWCDLLDWVGGYPFEVAKPEEITHFYRKRGFILTKLRTVGGALGNNEFVFERSGS